MSAASESPRRPVAFASWMLVLATVGWGISFPVTKALLLVESQALPGRASWLYSGALLAWRFGLAGLLLALLRPRALRRPTRREWEQGLGLGVIGSFGILLQTDGLNFTVASTSAFLTQFYCMLLPLVAAWRERRPPHVVVIVSCLTVLAGVGVLAGVDFRTFQLGRGEAETLLAACLFTGQILWLERGSFSANDPFCMSVVMFVSTGLILGVATWPHAQAASDLLVPFATRPAAVMLSVLTVVCTVCSYGLMNWWQPAVDATRAGLIYCAEPIFTSLFALTLPGWLATYGSVVYVNEILRRDLWIGGCLITAANVLILFRPKAAPVSVSTPPAQRGEYH